MLGIHLKQKVMTKDTAMHLVGLPLLARIRCHRKLDLSIVPSHDDGSLCPVLMLGFQPSFFKAPNGAQNSAHMLGIHLKQKAMTKETAMH